MIVTFLYLGISMSLHLGKTEAILFGSRRKLKLAKKNQAFCHNRIIKNVTCVKYLGIILNNSLSEESVLIEVIKKLTIE